MKRILTIISALVLLAGTCLWAQAQGQAQAAAPPLTKSEVIKGLKSKDSGQLMSQISQRGVEFDLTPEIEKDLRKAKADDSIIDIIRKAGPAARAEAAKTGGGAPAPKVTPEEGQAWSAVRNELDPDKEIQLVTDFEKNFPNSSLLSYVYYFGMNAYQQKGDITNEVALGEKSLKLNQDFLPSLIMVSSMLPQPQFLSAHPQEKERYLDEADNYANRALAEISDLKTFPKTANESDEQYNKRKNEASSNTRAALGMIHLERSQMALQGVDRDEVAKAEKEFEQAIALTERPSPQDYYRLGEAYSIDGKLDQAIQAFTKAGDLGQGTVIKTYADQRVQDLQKRKAQAQPATKP